MVCVNKMKCFEQLRKLRKVFFWGGRGVMPLAISYQDSGERTSQADRAFSFTDLCRELRLSAKAHRQADDYSFILSLEGEVIFLF